MKTQLEQFDRWLRQTGPFGLPRFVPVLLILLILGALGMLVISRIP